MKKYLKYLLITLKITGIFAIIITPPIAIIMLSFHFSNFYLLFLLIPYLLALIPYLAIVSDKYDKP